MPTGDRLQSLPSTVHRPTLCARVAALRDAIDSLVLQDEYAGSRPYGAECSGDGVQQIRNG